MNPVHAVRGNGEAQRGAVLPCSDTGPGRPPRRQGAGQRGVSWWNPT